jgi:hypothetical protein
MQRLGRNAWLGLLAMSLLIGLAGLWALLVGITEDQTVPVGLTGLTATQLQAQSPQGYRFADFGVRAGGMGLVVVAALLAGIVVFAFRQQQRWAWWALWALPVWGLSTVVLILVIGLVPGEAPPWPMISGTIVAMVGALLLLVSARQFQEGHHGTLTGGIDGSDFTSRSGGK